MISTTPGWLIEVVAHLKQPRDVNLQLGCSLFLLSYLQILVYVSIVLLMVPKLCALGSSMLLINLVAAKQAMGRVNGAGVTIQSLGRSLGPTLSGTIWAASVSLHVYGQQFLGFIVVCIGCAATQFVFARINVPERTK